MIGAVVKFKRYNSQIEELANVVSSYQGYEEFNDGIGNYTELLLLHENGEFGTIHPSRILAVIPVPLKKVEWARGQFGSPEHHYGMQTCANIAIVGEYLSIANSGEMQEKGRITNIEKWHDSKVVIVFENREVLELINIAFEATR